MVVARFVVVVCVEYCYRDDTLAILLKKQIIFIHEYNFIMNGTYFAERIAHRRCTCLFYIMRMMRQ